MAATQRVFRKARTKTCIVIYVFWLTVIVHHAHAQSTSNTVTTDNTTSSPATATQTPAPSTAATTQAQTTPAPTSRPQTSFPQNTDLGPCPCDLTDNGCDVNCCCDTDCSDSDRLAFSYCLPNSYLSKTDDKVCFQRDVVIIHNTPFEQNTTSDGLFCVYYDNYAKRNYYNIPDVITADDTERLEMYISRYAGPSFQTGSRLDPRTFPQIYKSDAPIYTVFENSVVGVLGLPAALHSSLCDDNNPAAYLYDQTSTCSRDLEDLGATCETSLAIRASTYYAGFKVVMNPSLLGTYFVTDNSSISNGNMSYSNISKMSELVTVTIKVEKLTLPMTMTPPPPITPPTEPVFTSYNLSSLLLSDPQPAFCNLDTIPDLYNNSCVLYVIPQSPHTCVSSPGGIPQLCNFTSLPRPRYNPNTGECSNAVTQVEYTVTTNGSSGITKVDVTFVFNTLQQSDLPISQTFITQFKGMDEREPVRWSGNPGYVVGQPVRAGQLVRELDPVDAVVLLAVQQNGTKPEDNSLTILKPSLSGECSTGTGGRTNVLFGEDMRSGCFISFNVSDMANGCQLMQEIALLALWPYGPDPPRNWSVATFGNSDPLTVGDWVSILIQNTPRSPVAGNGAECIDMVLGMHIQILYANVGSLSNPQAKIVGVSFIYESPQTIAFQCIGAYCQPGAESAQQRFEVVQSVTFVDVSQPSAQIYAEPPLFLAKVPYDFFYPFGLGRGTLIMPQSLLMILSALLSIFISSKSC